MPWFVWLPLAVYLIGVVALWRRFATNALADIEATRGRFRQPPAPYKVTSEDRSQAAWEGIFHALLWPPILAAVGVMAIGDRLGATLRTDNERRRADADQLAEAVHLATEYGLPLPLPEPDSLKGDEK
jgi:hypothetical protein